MGLPVADFNDCRQKCRCQSGENEGKLYTVEEPCPFGYTFNENTCDCGTPCDWCDDVFNEGYPDDISSWGVCRKESGEEPAGFQIEIVGRLDGYYRPWVSERCCATKFAEGGGKEYDENCPFDLEYFTTWEGPQLVARIPCPNSSSYGKDCGPYELLFDYRPAGCDSQRLPENNPWREGAFGFLWVIDPREEVNSPNWEIGRALSPPGGSTLYNGSYWVGEVSLRLSCYYENKNLFP